MADYWAKRHADALAKAESAPTPALRAIYLQLAVHYLSLSARAPPRAPD